MLAAIAQDPLLQETVRVGLALLFAGAALHKLRDPRAFTETLRVYRVLPDALVPLASVTTIILEVLVAAALLLPATAAAGALAASGLLAVYATAIAINLARGRRDIDCGCRAFAARRVDEPMQRLNGWLVARNAVLIAAALATLAPVHPRPLLWLDWVTMAGALTVCALTWEAAHRLLAEWERMRPHLVPAGDAE